MREFVPPRYLRLGPSVAVLGLTGALVLRVLSVTKPSQVDLDVYVMGARAVLAQQPLYAASVHDLYFTYPPFAAVVFAPLTLVDVDPARTLFAVGSLLSFVVVVYCSGKAVRLRPAGMVLLGAVGLVSEPFLRTLVLGQVNLYLMALVLLDLFVVPRRYQGLLIGLAAGLKLVPGVFVIYFLLKRDWSAAARAGVGFVVTVLVGAVAAPRDSWTYWSGGFLSLGRFGEAAVVGGDNQSVGGVVLRATHDLHPSTVLTVVIAGVSVAVATLVARRLLRDEAELAAVVALAVGGLLGSPVSWTHHWLWFVPVAAVLAARGWWVSAIAFCSVFVVGPMWALGLGSYRELSFDPGQQLVAAGYVLAGAFLLVRLLIGTRVPGPRESDSGPTRRPHDLDDDPVAELVS